MGWRGCYDPGPMTDPRLPLQLSVNGRPHRLSVEPRTTLLSLLREELELRGAKEGCDRGHCGACTVLLDDQPVYSCSRLALQCEGRRITTVEGLASGDVLAAVQQRFLDADAMQCGFCLPGQLVAAAALLRQTPRPDGAAVRRALAGNLCRCGAYQHILDALVGDGVSP